jgi:mycothiol maleylpyruvate isomerase-like protein
MTGIAGPQAQAPGATGRILRGVPADCWHAATPGAGWNARALVDHLVSGNPRAAELAADGTIEGVGSGSTATCSATTQPLRSTPQLMKACRQDHRAQVEAFRSAGAFGPRCRRTAGRRDDRASL